MTISEKLEELEEISKYRASEGDLYFARLAKENALMLKQLEKISLERHLMGTERTEAAILAIGVLEEVLKDGEG